ncbi:hypothetical protein M9458_055089, partial [Cirrhinus mrigala]
RTRSTSVSTAAQRSHRSVHFHCRKGCSGPEQACFIFIDKYAEICVSISS